MILEISSGDPGSLLSPTLAGLHSNVFTKSSVDPVIYLAGSKTKINLPESPVSSVIHAMSATDLTSAQHGRIFTHSLTQFGRLQRYLHVEDGVGRAATGGAVLLLLSHHMKEHPPEEWVNTFNLEQEFFVAFCNNTLNTSPKQLIVYLLMSANLACV